MNTPPFTALSMRISAYEECSKKLSSSPISCCICLTRKRSTCCHDSGLRMWSTRSTDSLSRTGWTAILRHATKSLPARIISWSTWILRSQRLLPNQLKSAVSSSLNLIVCSQFSNQWQGRSHAESWFKAQKIYCTTRWAEGRGPAQIRKTRRVGAVESWALTKTRTSRGAVKRSLFG